MTRRAPLLASLVLVLVAFAAEAGAAALKPLPTLNGVRCRQVVNSDDLSGFAGGRARARRSYVVTVEFSTHSPYGRRPEDVRFGSWVRATRTGWFGHVY